MLKAGIYEQVLNNLISKEIDPSLHIVKMGLIDHEEAAKVLAQYLTLVIEQVLANVKDNGGRVENQVALCNRLIDTMVTCVGEASLTDLSIDGQAKMLLALLARQNSANAINEKTEIVRPITSIASSSLFTGALHEPSMLSELKKEILSCDRIDMLVSFIKWSPAHYYGRTKGIYQKRQTAHYHNIIYGCHRC